MNIIKTNFLFDLGIILLVFAPITLYNIFVLCSLMYGTYPWHWKSWNGMRKDANQLLIDSGIRDMSLDDQMDYMTDQQNKDIVRYKSTYLS